MVDYLEILRLKHLGYSQRQIIGSVGCSSHTIKDTWEAPMPENTTNEELKTILFPNKSKPVQLFAEPDYAYIHGELAKPKNKSHAEATVRMAETWILAALRNQKFFSLSEMREAVAEKLEELNTRAFTNRSGNRKTAYLEEELQYMLPLPKTPYEAAVWSVAKVPNYYVVTDGLNKYSVPYVLIGEKVDIKVTRNIVEVFYKGSKVASHKRMPSLHRDPIVKEEHMPQEHRKYLYYNADSFIEWATKA